MFVVSLLNVVSKLNDDTLGGSCQHPCSQWVNHLFILAFMKPSNRKAGSFGCFFRFIFTQRLVEINVLCCNILLNVQCHGMFFSKNTLSYPLVN